MLLNEESQLHLHFRWAGSIEGKIATFLPLDMDQFLVGADSKAQADMLQLNLSASQLLTALLPLLVQHSQVGTCGMLPYSSSSAQTVWFLKFEQAHMKLFLGQLHRYPRHCTGYGCAAYCSPTRQDSRTLHACLTA